MSKPSPLYRVEVDATELDLLVVDEQGQLFAACATIVCDVDPITRSITRCSILEQTKEHEPDALPSPQNPAHLPVPEVLTSERTPMQD